jgi:hypothetical protein
MNQKKSKCECSEANRDLPAIENYTNPLTELKRRVENGEKASIVAVELGIVKENSNLWRD